MPSTSRIRNLSTRYLELYRYGVVAILSLLVIALLYNSFQGYKTKGLISSLYFPFVWGYVIFLWLKVNAKVFRVEFDDDYLYIIKRQHDILIPLENIKDINMKSLGGVWRVDLFYADVVGDHFYFKPSLLYPLNYKSKDALVNVLWSKIEAAKTKRQPVQRNALHS